MQDFFIDIDADTKLLKGVNMCVQKNIKSLPMICFVLITKNDSRYKQYIFIYVFKIIVEVLNHSFVQGLFSTSLNHRLWILRLQPRLEITMTSIAMSTVT